MNELIEILMTGYTNGNIHIKEISYKIHQKEN